MRVKSSDRDFDKVIIGLDGKVMHRGDILEASEEEGKIWVYDPNNPLGYSVYRGRVTIRKINAADANTLMIWM